MPRAVPAYECGRCATLTLHKDLTRKRVRLSGATSGEYFEDLCPTCTRKEVKGRDLKPLTKRPIRDLPPAVPPGDDE